MRVVCGKRDQDLLFLSHGMLSGLKKLFMGLHLRRCDNCKERVADFSEASRQLRLAFGGSPPVVSTVRPVSRLSLALIAAVLLAALGYATYTIIGNDEIVTEPTRTPCIPQDSKWGKMLQNDDAQDKPRPKTKAKLSGSRMTIHPPKKK